MPLAMFNSIRVWVRLNAMPDRSNFGCTSKFQIIPQSKCVCVCVSVRLNSWLTLSGMPFALGTRVEMGHPARECHIVDTARSRAMSVCRDEHTDRQTDRRTQCPLSIRLILSVRFVLVSSVTSSDTFSFNHLGKHTVLGLGNVFGHRPGVLPPPSVGMSFPLTLNWNL